MSQTLGQGLALALLASTASSQTLDIKLQKGDTMIGLGEVKSLFPGLVNDQGMWVLQMTADLSDKDHDEALVRNGYVTLREGTALFDPPGATVKAFRSKWLTNSGDLALALDLNNTTPNGATAAFWNTKLLGIEAGPIVAPGLPAGTTWASIDVVKVNDANTVLVLGEVKQPLVSQRDDALVRFQLDASGNVLSTDLALVKGMNVPALGDTVLFLGNTEHALALNRRGDFLTLIDATAVPTAYVINLDTIVAQEGSPAPSPGRTYGALTLLPKLSINDFKEYAFGASLNGDEDIIVKNGAKFAQENDVIPSLGSAQLGAGSSAPVYIANSGDLFWWAQLKGTNRDAFLRNLEVIVQQNVTRIDGMLVTSISRSPGAFHVSPDGRFWVGNIDLQTVGEGFLFVDFGLVVPVPGCLGNAGQLALLDGRPYPGNTLRLSMDNGQADGVTPILVFSTRAAIPGSDCGISTRFGELLISPANKFARLVGQPWNGTPSVFSIAIPPSASLSNLVAYAQGFFWDMGDQTPAVDFRLTNGVRIEIGAP